MSITTEATFRAPMPADYGRAMQAKRRASRKATPPTKKKLTGIELIMSETRAEESIKTLAEFKRRREIEPIAEAQWRALNIIRRAWLSFRGHTPISYYEAQR